MQHFSIDFCGEWCPCLRSVSSLVNVRQLSKLSIIGPITPKHSQTLTSRCCCCCCCCCWFWWCKLVVLRLASECMLPARLGCAVCGGACCPCKPCPAAAAAAAVVDGLQVRFTERQGARKLVCQKNPKMMHACHQSQTINYKQDRQDQRRSAGWCETNLQP